MKNLSSSPLLAAVALLAAAAFSISLDGCRNATASAGATPASVAATAGVVPVPEPSARADRTAHCASPHQYLVIIDISLSRDQVILEQNQQFLKDMVKRLCFGDEIVFQQVHYNGAHDGAKEWSKNMPTVSDDDSEAVLASTVDAVRGVVNDYFQSTDGQPVRFTDLFTTLNDAGQYAGDGAGRSRVVLMLSDMLQSTDLASPDGVEMEGLRRMPPPNWVEKQKEQGLLPNFHGACVFVIGGDVSTPNGAVVRRFWKDYFAATGASLADKNYRSTIPLPGTEICD